MDAIDGRNGNSSEPARMAEQELLCRASPLACKPIFVVWYLPLSACEAWQPCHHPDQEHGESDNKQEYEHSVLIARNHASASFFALKWMATLSGRFPLLVTTRLAHASSRAEKT